MHHRIIGVQGIIAVLLCLLLDFSFSNLARMLIQDLADYYRLASRVVEQELAIILYLGLQAFVFLSLQPIVQCSGAVAFHQGFSPGILDAFVSRNYAGPVFLYLDLLIRIELRLPSSVAEPILRAIYLLEWVVYLIDLLFIFSKAQILLEFSYELLARLFEILSCLISVHLLAKLIDVEVGRPAAQALVRVAAVAAAVIWLVFCGGTL